MELAWRVVAEHETALRAAAAGLCRGRPAELDDLIQDTFERALRHFRANRTPPDNMRAWLVSIMRHVFVDRLRASRVHVPCDDDLAQPVPEPQPIWADVSVEDVRRALRDVDAPLREAFELHYLQGRPYVEVAATLSIPVNTVANRLYRARKALREALMAPIIVAAKGGAR
jgi:RNA polymerase sigma-70 factor (ECF subfamily)